MLDLIYKLADWIVDYEILFPIPVDVVTSEPAYLLAMHQNTIVIIYLLYTIALLLFLFVVFLLFKFITYTILDAIF